MSDDEFMGEYPAFAPAPLFTGDMPTRGYVTGNFVAEPGAYACARCRDYLAPPHVLRAGQRVPGCPHCGPDARWVKC
jgi:hypothetical protein